MDEPKTEQECREVLTELLLEATDFEVDSARAFEDAGLLTNK